MTRTLLSLTFIFGFLLGQTQSTLDSYPQPTFESGQIIAQIQKNTTPEQVVFDIQNKVSGLQSLHVEKLLSKHMQTWLFGYDPSEISEQELLREFRTNRNISIAQLNHHVQSRETIPNDEFFGDQWHHVEGGDHDIDTDLAWDITTGGYTSQGDRIVACVIEGANYNHVDLIDNHWVNDNEIPDNGEDDDNNGFIDDYHGWNAPGGDDDVDQGNHGTAVASMIGARGDNETGITGVNWDVGIMNVELGGIGGPGNVNEANVIEAYNYPLEMRKLYNETDGELGAFVVVTNASWGVDFGDPINDGPIWCAYYDTLGVHGILNCGATANNNVNIDEVGDLPTACGSDYMVSVTATNNNDIRTFSGYGATTIDLGAPGESVYLASGSDAYSPTSGTSFASPCTAGAIALLYSIPCGSFMDIVHSNPQAGADMVLQALYDGVDPVPNLVDECVTGGRLNVNNSVELLLATCSTDECLVPFGIQVEGDGIDDYTVSWSSIPSMLSFDLRYRIVGEPEWTVISGISENEFTLVDLLWCSEYEVQLSANCELEESAWSDSELFSTIGCCNIPDVNSIIVTQVGETSADLFWDTFLAATGFEVEISPAGEGAWASAGTVEEPQITIGDLTLCTFYDIRIRAICGADMTDWSGTFTFVTQGCDDCTNLLYCEITGDGSEEWIDQVTINTIDNLSGSDGGYGDYSDISTQLNVGQEYEITLTPGYTDFTWTESFRVWIDFNGNQEYEEEELLYESPAPTTTAVTAMIMIPSSAVPGPAGMRVSMDYVTENGGGTMPVECGELEFGEAEDYCILITNDVSVDEITSGLTWNLYPNPANEILTIEVPQVSLEDRFVITNTLGAQVMTMRPTASKTVVDISDLETGVYFVTVYTTQGRDTRRVIVSK